MHTRAEVSWRCFYAGLFLTQPFASGFLYWQDHSSWGWTCAEWPACVCIPVLRYGRAYLYREGALFWLWHWEIWAFWSHLLKKINQGWTQLAFENWVPNWKFPAIILTILLLSKHFDISYDNEHSPQGRIEQDHQWEGATNNCAPCSSHNNLILSYWEAPFCLACIELLGILFPFWTAIRVSLEQPERL